MKIKNKTRKYVTITIEKCSEEKSEKGYTENKTLYWLVNTKTPDGRGVGFRADSDLRVWSMLMQECPLI